KLQPMILRRIVARREVNRPIQFAPLNFIRDRWRRSERFAKQRANAVMLQNLYRQLRKLLRIKPRVITHENGGVLCLRLYMLGNRRKRQPDVCERELVGDQSSPA